MVKIEKSMIFDTGNTGRTVESKFRDVKRFCACWLLIISYMPNFVFLFRAGVKRGM